MPKSLTELRAKLAHTSVTGVLTDIDDTLTSQGKLHASTYAAMQRLREAGIKLVPITGGPASLALHAARLWPVSAAIGESGAVLYHHDGKQLHTQYWDDANTREQQQAKREQTLARLKQAIPRLQLASDQCFRLCDLAINHSEDFFSEAEKLNADEVKLVRKMLSDEGYTVRQSSIHFNAWLGSYDKLPMAKHALKTLWNIDLDSDASAREHWVYIGDAPNDEAMFEFFPTSVGVANVRPHLGHMQHPPAFIAERSHGAGFEEVVALLLSLR